MAARWGPDLVKGADGRYHNPELSTLHLRREGPYGTDKPGRYKVIVDGRTVGRIGSGSSDTFMVNPGHRALTVRRFWTGSRVVRFDIGPGETRWHLCGPRGRGGVMRRLRKGIELRQVTQRGADL